MRRDPWANDPDRTTRRETPSVAPPVRREFPRRDPLAAVARVASELNEAGADEARIIDYLERRFPLALAEIKPQEEDNRWAR